MAITVVGRMNTARDAHDVVRDLTSVCHCDDGDISLATLRPENGAPTHGTGGVVVGAMKGLVGGAVLGGIVGFVVGAASIAVPGFEGVIARGPAASIIVGAGVFAVLGVLIGALTSSERRSSEEPGDDVLMGRTGTLITVHAREDQEADCVINVMRHHGAREIDKRSSDWNKRDWGDYAEAQEPALRVVPDRAAAADTSPRSYNRPMEEAASAAEPASATVHSTEGWITRTYTATYFGPERRRAANQQPYQGAERRHSAA